MKKPFKVMTSSTLAALVATSTAIVPAMAAEVPAESSASIEKVLVQYEGQTVSLTLDDYIAALEAEVIEASAVSHVQVGSKVVTIEEYTTYLEAFDNLDEALAEIEANADEATVDSKDGTLGEDGIVVEDEQPEDRLNETLVYNFAA